MNQMEEALYRAGAHIIFKEVNSSKEETPLKKWREITFPGKIHKRKGSQRIIGGVARDPVDRTAALVTSKRPKI